MRLLKGLFLVGAFLLPIVGLAQQTEDIYVFGFAQTIYNSKDVEAVAYPYPADNPVNGIPFVFNSNFESNTFAAHQINLFFRKPISDDVTFFLNFEASGSFSTNNQSGNFQIPEGWLFYEYSDALKLKVGLLLPRFNNLNEIKNRLPLFPYIIRPAVYEGLFSGIIKLEDYVPQQAFVQLTGEKFITDDLIADYAFYIGNSEASYNSKLGPGEGSITTSEGAALFRGESLTKKLSYGTRLGIKNITQDFKLGVSGTYDHDNRNELDQRSISRFEGIYIPVYGDVPRYRLGADLQFTYRNFDFESEYIGVFHDYTKIRKIPQYRNASLDKQSFYANLTYRLSEKYFMFGGYGTVKDQSFEFMVPDSPDKAGLVYSALGGGYKFLDSVVLKAQYTSLGFGDNPYTELNVNLLTAGVSVIF
jgi:hypothetical protein